MLVYLPLGLRWGIALVPCCGWWMCRTLFLGDKRTFASTRCVQERTHGNEVQVNPLVRVLQCCGWVTGIMHVRYSIPCSIVALAFWQAALFSILSDAVAGSLDILAQESQHIIKVKLKWKENTPPQCHCVGSLFNKKHFTVCPPVIVCISRYNYSRNEERPLPLDLYPLYL